MYKEATIDEKKKKKPEEKTTSGLPSPHEDIIAFTQLLIDSEVPKAGILPIIFSSFATPQNPLSKIELTTALGEAFPSWQKNTAQYTWLLLNGAKEAGHTIVTTKMGRHTSYHLESNPVPFEQTPVAIALPQLAEGETKADALRRLADEGLYTRKQLLQALFPDMDEKRQSDNFAITLNRLKKSLMLEGASIPDGRLSPGGTVKIFRSEATQLRAGVDIELEQETTPTEVIAENTDQVPHPSDDREAGANEKVDIQVSVLEIPKNGVCNDTQTKPMLIAPLDRDTGLFSTHINMPNGKKTKSVELSSDEYHLFEAIFTKANTFSREELELAMINIARSATFDGLGGFERVFNSLNTKILSKWNMCLVFNDNGFAVLTGPDGPQASLIPQVRKAESDREVRREGRIHKRQFSHRKLK